MNKEALLYNESRLKELLQRQEALEHAIVIIRANRRMVEDGVRLAIDEFKREAEDVRFTIEEIKIHLEKNNE